MKNLPALLKKKTAIKKKEKATVPATPKRDLVATADTMMQLSGKIESRIVPGHCAKHDKPFTIFYERRSRHHKFQIIKICADMEDTGVTDGILGKLTAKRQSDKTSFNAEDFDSSGKYCPHCGYNDIFVQCNGCKQTVCGSRIRKLENGDQLFACSDSCGKTGKLSPCDHMHGSKNTPKDLSPAVNNSQRLKQTRKSSQLKLGRTKSKVKRLEKK